jgi:uncharacterized membrane protein
MGRRLGWLWTVLILLACIGYQCLVHSALAGGQAEPVRIALAFLPLLALASWIITSSRNKPLWIFILVAAGVTIFLLERQEQWGLAAAYSLPHAVIYSSLLWLFGHTLLPGRQALVTRLAQRVHGTLSPDMEIYTRRITVAWCLFFLGQLIASLLLFTLSSLEVWSLFINFLNVPLVLLMFAGEYVYRVIRHPEFPHASILDAMRAFAQDSAHSSSAKVR